MFSSSKSKKSKSDESNHQNESHLHVFLLKDGNKHQLESPLLSINDYDQAIEIQKTSESLTKRAYAYFHIRDYEQAMNDIEQALKLNPRSIEAYCCAASIQVALNDYQKAFTYLSEAYDLSSPMDFQRKSIEEVMNGCKMSLRINTQSAKGISSGSVNNKSSTESAANSGNFAQTQTAFEKQVPEADIRNSSSSTLSSASTLSSSMTNDDPFEYNQALSAKASIVNSDSGSSSGKVKDKDKDGHLQSYMSNENMEVAAEKLVDMPFDNSEFMDLQKDITQQMVDIGGEEFQSKLMKLNEIPAVQAFQRKALAGEKPSYDDYMLLMKDPKFQKYNAIMTEIAQNPKFAGITQKFAQMDWMGAYEELQKDPEALALYMKAFEGLD